MTLIKRHNIQSGMKKQNYSSVASSWDGTETYWTATGDKVYTTTVGVDPADIQLQHVSFYVDATSSRYQFDFPDSDDYYPGEYSIGIDHPVITKREVHIFNKLGSFPNEHRVDYYNGATLLAQIYTFRDFSDVKEYKWGVRIRNIVAPSSFYFNSDGTTDTPFADYGIIILGGFSNNITVPADVVGNTYYFSVPTAYIPGGKSLLGGAMDSSARILALAAFVITILTLIYVMFNRPTTPTTTTKK